MNLYSDLNYIFIDPCRAVYTIQVDHGEKPADFLLRLIVQYDHMLQYAVQITLLQKTISLTILFNSGHRYTEFALASMQALLSADFKLPGH